MAQERLAATAISTGALGASVGAYTAATEKHKLVLSPSRSSGSASAKGFDTYLHEKSPSQTSDPSTVSPIILSRSDDPTPSLSQLSNPSSTSITPFILPPLRLEEPLPQYASAAANYAEPLKPSAVQRNRTWDSP